jgi:hypothetical protein
MQELGELRVVPGIVFWGLVYLVIRDVLRTFKSQYMLASLQGFLYIRSLGTFKV